MPLIVTIDLVPGDDLLASREIGRMIVINEGTHKEAPERGNYQVLQRRASPQPRETWWIEQVGEANDIQRYDNPWLFLAELLERLELDT